MAWLLAALQTKPYGIGDDISVRTAAYASPIESQDNLELDDAVAGSPIDVSSLLVSGRLPSF